jgi:hypothetical protein
MEFLDCIPKREFGNEKVWEREKFPFDLSAKLKAGKLRVLVP